MDRELFIQSSTRTRVLEKRLLDKIQMQRLIEADDVDELIRLLNDSQYQPFINKLERPEDYTQALAGEQQRFFTEMYGVSPRREVVDLVTLKYLYHNLKVILKEKITGEDYSRMYINIGGVDMNKLKADFEAGNTPLENQRQYEDLNYVYTQYENMKDPQMIDILLDRAYFEELKVKAEALDSEFFTQYVEDLIDLTNIKTLLRCQKQDKDPSFLNKVIIPGGSIDKSKYEEYLHTKVESNSNLFKSARIYYYASQGIAEFEKTGSLAGFEKMMDDYLMYITSEAKRVTYGPEVIFAYLQTKETEIKNLGIIFVAKLNGLSPEFIRERLRDNNV